MEQGAVLIAAILAVLNTGKMYLPLEPNDSIERLAANMQECESKAGMKRKHQYHCIYHRVCQVRPIFSRTGYLHYLHRRHTSSPFPIGTITASTLVSDIAFSTVGLALSAWLITLS